MINTQLWLIGATRQINLQDPAQGYYLQPDIEGLTGLPGIRTSEGINVGKDGGWTGPQQYDARFIAIPTMIAHPNVATVEARRRDLITLLAEKRLMLKYVTEGGSTYTTKVVVMDAPAPLKKNLHKVEMKINLKADDPLLYDFVSTGGGLVATLNVRKPGGGFEINFTLPLEISGGTDSTAVENTGTSTVAPTITLYGPLQNPTIVNQTTNQQMQILANLNVGDVIEINTQLETITMNGTDIYYLIDGTPDFIEIGPGVNSMYLTSSEGGAEGHAEVKFNSGYIGI
jgi:hypothetical protein